MRSCRPCVRSSDSSQKVDRDEFATFTEEALSRHPSIEALEWVPLVEHKERAELETIVRGEGYGQFSFSELGTDGLWPAPVRSAYAPVLYLEPAANNENILGFDLLSDSSRRAALVKARDTGALVATRIIEQLPDLGGDSGRVILAMMPVYRKGVPTGTVEERRSAFRGVVVAVFDLDELFAETKEGNNNPFGIELIAYEANRFAFPGDLLFGTTNAFANDRLRLDSILAGLRVARSIEIADRRIGSSSPTRIRRRRRGRVPGFPGRQRSG